MTPYVKMKNPTRTGRWGRPVPVRRARSGDLENDGWIEKQALFARERLDPDFLPSGGARKPNRLPEDPPNVYELFEL